MTPSTQSFLCGMVCGLGLATACFIVVLLARPEPEPRQRSESQPALSEPSQALKTSYRASSGPQGPIVTQKPEGLFIEL